jgi:hypothetical protein
MATLSSNGATYRVVVEKDVPMRTRDGVTLYADVYRPDTTERFPVLVMRTPYDKSIDMALMAAIGLMPGGMSGLDLAQAIWRVREERIVDRQYRAARISEDDLHALHLEGFDEGLRPGQLHDGCPS